MSRVFETYLRTLVKSGFLTIDFAGRRVRFGDGTGAELALRFADRRVAWALVRNPVLSFGELYMAGRITVTAGSLYEVVSLFSQAMHDAGRNDWIRLLDRFRDAISGLRRSNSLSRSRANVAVHYDLDAGLYELFLDDDRQYSCAYFEHSGTGLEEAQLAKKRHIAAKLAVEPGQRVLDIGCGWGGMAMYLARYTDARVHGITLSTEQVDAARTRIETAGLQDRVSVALQDYRQTRGSYDRIVSVGMLEHVGRKNLRTYFQRVADLLEDDGVALVHTIGLSGVPWPTNEWVNTYIFPGGYIPALSEIADAAERARLYITDIEVLRLHYAETIRLWRARFEANRERARALYDERFCRMWELYLCGAECAFRIEGSVNFQLQLAKRVDALPMTRGYLAEREQALRRIDSMPSACAWPASSERSPRL